MVDRAPQRRWFRFSLRTFFVVVTALCCWLGYGLNWMRQRHDALEQLHIGSYSGEAGGTWNNVPLDVYHMATTPRGVKPPWCIRLLGEAGMSTIAVYGPDHATAAEEFKRPFPEASVTSAESPPALLDGFASPWRWRPPIATSGN